MLLLLTVASGAVAAIAGGGSYFWLSLPLILLAVSLAPTRRGALLSAGVILAAAGIPLLVVSGLRPAPPAPLIVLVVGASVAVVLVARGRWERERHGLRRSALTDQLTGIANRRFLLGRISYEIARHDRAGGSFALVMIDLDGFKRLNDRFGHATGDELLRDVANALKVTVRAQDTAARIGGDEFCVLAPETHDAGIEHLVERVLGAVGTVTTGIETMGARAGVAVFPDDGATPDELLGAADQRLIAAKRGGRRGRRERTAA